MVFIACTVSIIGPIVTIYILFIVIFWSRKSRMIWCKIVYKSIIFLVCKILFGYCLPFTFYQQTWCEHILDTTIHQQMWELMESRVLISTSLLDNHPPISSIHNHYKGWAIRDHHGCQSSLRTSRIISPVCHGHQCEYLYKSQFEFSGVQLYLNAAVTIIPNLSHQRILTSSLTIRTE